jgi:2-dehydropantoate 2-reductase
MPKRVCIIGCGAIGSLYAAHLARVAEVHALVRRPQHAEAINQHGIRVSGKRDFTSKLMATTDPATLPAFDLGIVSTKATQTADAFAPVAHLFNRGAIISAQNGLGAEEVLAEHTKGYIIRATTFMSGSRHSDTHVQMELDTATWMGPFEPTNTPFAVVKEATELIVAGGLKAEALKDARPAQWSKLIFNSSVNSVAALTELPHCSLFAEENNFSDLGHLLHALIDEGKAVAAGLGVELHEDPWDAGLGVELHEDPWEMNKVGAQTDHPPSMLYDVNNRLQTEVDFLGGAIARGKETSWTWKPKSAGRE